MIILFAYGVFPLVCAPTLFPKSYSNHWSDKQGFGYFLHNIINISRIFSGPTNILLARVFEPLDFQENCTKTSPWCRTIYNPQELMLYIGQGHSHISTILNRNTDVLSLYTPGSFNWGIKSHSLCTNRLIYQCTNIHDIYSCK